MTGNHVDGNPSGGNGVSRREVIKKIAVGSAFAAPVVASFDMASLGVGTAYANNANQSPGQQRPPAFASASSATFTVGGALTFAFWVTGSGAVQMSAAGALPSGLKFTAIDDNYAPDNDCNGTLSGRPAAGTGGVHHITVKASNYKGQATQKFTVIVNERPQFTSHAKATVHVGREANVRIVTSGYPHAAITVSGALPAGMHLTHDPAAGTAAISGKPASRGVHHLKLTASNGVAPNATQAFTLTVA